MDPLKNPFAPGPGKIPPALVGRDEVLRRYEIMLGRLKLGKSPTPIFMYGLRGVGKTVLLLQIERRAKEMGFFTDRFEVDEVSEFNFQTAILTRIKNLILQLSSLEKLKENYNRLVKILRNLSFKYSEFEFGLDLDLTIGEADSGNFADDLPLLLTQLGMLAADKGKQVCLLLDEVQNLNKKDMSALLSAMHRVGQEQLPITIVPAGLPSLLARAAEAKSYAERFDYVSVGPLDDVSARLAILEPFHQEGAFIINEVVTQVVALAKGYPYFIQQFGEALWNEATEDTATVEDLERAVPIAMNRLDNGFFQARYNRSTEEERRFLGCMAQQPSPPYDIALIGKCLDKNSQHVGTYRIKLIDKGLIFSPSYGKVDFTVPLFDDYLRRIS